MVQARDKCSNAYQISLQSVAQVHSTAEAMLAMPHKVLVPQCISVFIEHILLHPINCVVVLVVAVLVPALAHVLSDEEPIFLPSSSSGRRRRCSNTAGRRRQRRRRKHTHIHARCSGLIQTSRGARPMSLVCVEGGREDFWV